MPIDTDYEDCPTCPHCGEQDYDETTNDEEWERGHWIHCCPSCGKAYNVELHTTWTFSSKPQEE